MWAPIYGAILNIEFFQPLAALVKSADGLSFFASENGILFVSIVTIVLTSALVALGMAGYARIQKWCLYLGLVGFAIMVVLMVVSSQADFKAAFDRANEAHVRGRRARTTRRSPTPPSTTAGSRRSRRPTSARTSRTRCSPRWP